MQQYASALRLQVIGECCKQLEGKHKKPNREIFRRFENIRDNISHLYKFVNKDLIWEMLNKDIPKLKKVVRELK